MKKLKHGGRTYRSFVGDKCYECDLFDFGSACYAVRRELCASGVRWRETFLSRLINIFVASLNVSGAKQGDESDALVRYETTADLEREIAERKINVAAEYGSPIAREAKKASEVPTSDMTPELVNEAIERR